MIKAIGMSTIARDPPCSNVILTDAIENLRFQNLLISASGSATL